MPEAPAFTLSDFLAARSHAREQPSPWVSFYELTIPNGSPLRYCSLMDPRAGGSLPEKVVFNGFEWAAAAITRGPIQESSDGSNLTFELGVGDLNHEGAFLLRENDGLNDELLKIYTTTYDAIGAPTSAFVEEYTVISSHIVQGPDGVILVVGHYNLFEARFPKVRYERRCSNPWQSRFVPGNTCSYPSNEFGLQLRQRFTAGAIVGIRPVKAGWFTQQSARADSFDIASPLYPHTLSVVASKRKLAWLGEDRYGPAYFRLLTGDFDCHTLVSTIFTGRQAWTAGLFVQDEAAHIPLGADEIIEPPQIALSSWVFWGIARRSGFPSGTSELLARKTTSNVSISTRTTPPDKYLRMARVGNTFDLYSKFQEADAWTLRRTETLTLPSKARIGLLIGADVDEAVQFGAKFEYLRFTSGGETECDRTGKRCSELQNRIQFNGFEGIPDDRARY